MIKIVLYIIMYFTLSVKRLMFHIIIDVDLQKL